MHAKMTKLLVLGDIFQPYIVDYMADIIKANNV